jgi:hypothetical protein
MGSKVTVVSLSRPLAFDQMVRKSASQTYLILINRSKKRGRHKIRSANADRADHLDCLIVDRLDESQHLIGSIFQVLVIEVLASE